MTSPTPTQIKYGKLINEIAEGKIRIPQFQRDFVWEMDKSARLMDSIVKGYPIGTFIFWRTKERLRSVKKFGKEVIPSLNKDDFVTYVLDGQQRLTSLYAIHKGDKIERSPRKTDNFGNIYINLNADKSEEIVITDVTDLPDKTYIRLTDLLADKSHFVKILQSFSDSFQKKILEYSEIFSGYQFSVIQVESATKVKEVPIEIATEIFTRINVSGKELKAFEIMVAKTYDEVHGFDLSKKYDELIKELAEVDYHTISSQTILRVIAQILKNDSKNQTILYLEKSAFIETWEGATNGVIHAVEHFRDVFRIPVSRLLPYLDLIVPFAYFFYHHPERPTPEQARELENFFWHCSLSNRYSASVDSKLTQDIRRIDRILENKTPKYDWKINTTPEHLIEHGWFNTGTSFIKAILCIMAYKQPKSFDSDRIVRISNDWLKQRNSKNYHHYFPLSFLKKNGGKDGKGVDDFLANNIVNITIVDDYLNKRKIRAKSPSEYMKKFKDENKNLAETMKTHLIGDLTEFGIWNNDYNTFMQKRAEVICEEIKKRIIER